MSNFTRAELPAKQRDRYARAGKELKGKFITEPVELFGSRSKSAIHVRPLLKELGALFSPFQAHH